MKGVRPPVLICASARSSALAKQLNIEDERCVGRDDAAGAPGPVTQLCRDHESPLAALLPCHWSFVGKRGRFLPCLHAQGGGGLVLELQGRQRTLT